MSAVIYRRIVKQDLELGVGSVSATMPGGGSSTGDKVNLATLATEFSQSWGPGTIAANSKATVSVATPGSKAGDVALATFSTMNSDLILQCICAADDTTAVILHNPTASAVATSSGTLKVYLFRIVP